MKQAEQTNYKATFDIRKRTNNGKLFQIQKSPIQQLLTKKTMGKKYMQQQNIFKRNFEEPKKQHRQIVMSEEFIRSSKLFRLLKQKMDRTDSMFIKQANSLNEHKFKLKEDIMQLKSQNYQEKISLWELKNKLMELKTMYQEQQQQSKRLAQQNYDQYEGEMQEAQNEPTQENENQSENQEYLQNQNEQKTYNYKEQIGQDKEEQMNVNSQEEKNHFSEILEELMSLKAERNRMQKQFSKVGNENSSTQSINMFQYYPQKQGPLSQ